MRRSIVMAIILVLAAAAGTTGWRWLQSVPVRTVVVRGMVHADSAQVVDLAGVDTGVPVMSVDAALSADRVRRHPWVERASVSRNPTGTVVISIRERRPVAVTLDAAGDPAYFFDADGYRMPWTPGLDLPLPIVRGIRERYHPVTPARSRPVRSVLALLPDLEEEQDALLSEIHETDEGIEIYTAVSPAGQSIRVRLGRDGFHEKMSRLQAFWYQSVLHRPTTTYEWIDLRFARQVVTRERA